MKYLYRGLLMAGCLINMGTSAKPLAIGESLPSSMICQDKDNIQQPDWQKSLKLVVLLPEQSDYEGMMRYAFDQYFKSQNAFSSPRHERNIQVIYINGSQPKNSISWPYQNDCEAISSQAAVEKLSHLVGVLLPKTNQSDATVLLLDKQNIVRWRADDYHAQGERLKPLEKTIKALLGQPDPIAPNANTQKRPNIGDIAPDFALGNDQHLSDLRGKTVLVTFYPAAFSGIIPTAKPITSEAAKTTLEAKQRSMMMCSIQLTSLDAPASTPNNVTDPHIIKLAISSAQPALLREWKNLLNTHDMNYISDIDYSISQQYGSYDATHGYNQRTVFIINKAGKIAFVDDNYTIDDADTVQEALKTISTQP